MSKVNLENKYNLVLGAGKYGKSYLVKKTAPKRTLYINYIGELKDFDGWLKVGRNVDMNLLGRVLHQNRKVVFTCSKDNEQAIQEVLYLYDWAKGKGINLILDECHVYEEDKRLKRLLQNSATHGRHDFPSITWLSVRMAVIPNILATQAEQVIFFHTRNEKAYYSSKGISHEEISKKINGRKYYFVVVTDDSISEAKKL